MYGPKGPGDFLHDTIQFWLRETPTEGCNCWERIHQMNAWGPLGCREHLDEIVGWMMEKVTHRGWWKYAVAVPGSRLFIRRMVLGAIQKAEPGPKNPVTHDHNSGMARAISKSDSNDEDTRPHGVWNPPTSMVSAQGEHEASARPRFGQTPSDAPYPAHCPPLEQAS